MCLFEIRPQSAPTASLFLEADEAASPLQQLHEGTKVRVLQCVGAFAQIQVLFDEAVQGWVRKRDVSCLSVAGEKQHIVRLVAGCSSGKSLVEESLKKDSNWVVIDDDPLCYEYMIAALRERFPKELSVISEGIEEENLYHAFLRDQVCFKKEIAPEKKQEILKLLVGIRKELDEPCNIDWRGRVWSAVEARIIKDIQEASKTKNVLVTVSSVSWGRIEKGVSSQREVSSQIVKVFLYTPLGEAFDRCIERNEAAEKSGKFEPKRFCTFVPESYCRLETLTLNREAACDAGSRKEMEAIFDRAIGKIERKRPEGTSRTFSQYDFSEKQIRDWQKGFFSQLGEGQDVCYITPKDPYDVILSGGKATPEELTQSLLNVVALRE